MGELTQETEVLVIGAGPGGYAAAFRAADLGLEVTLVDVEPRPGGVCLHRGCIPSKTLLFLTELLHDARRAADMGVTFDAPHIRLEQLRAWKAQVIDRLAGGLVHLCAARGVQFLQGRAEFEGPDRVRLHDAEVARMRFRHAVLATGSRPKPLPGVAWRPGGRVMDSTGALALDDIPERLLVVGGGYVGVELGSVYAALGSRVTLVEHGARLLPGVDRDLVKPLARRLEGSFAGVHLKTRVKSLTERGDRVEVTLEGEGAGGEQHFERVLVAVGRSAASERLGIEHTGATINEHGFVVVDAQQRTSAPRVFAVGDVAGGAMLAHKAMREGRVAAEVIAGKPSAFDVRAIPAVVYTDPQIAVCGVSEDSAARENRPLRVTRFPWSASGRAMTMGAAEGLTKILFDPETERVLGMGIVGRGAGEMIAEGVLAVEMGVLAEDLALSMAPHPTLSETEEEAAEAFLGSATHIITPR